jgi:hypothetical protein
MEKSVICVERFKAAPDSAARLTELPAITDSSPPEPPLRTLRSGACRRASPIDAELRIVRGAVPAVARGLQLCSQAKNGLTTSFSVSTAALTIAALMARLTLGLDQEIAILGIERLFAANGARCPETSPNRSKNFSDHPRGLAAAFGLRSGVWPGPLAPILRLHLAVEVLQRTGGNLVDDGLDGLAVFGGGSGSPRRFGDDPNCSAPTATQYATARATKGSINSGKGTKSSLRSPRAVSQTL